MADINHQTKARADSHDHSHSHAHVPKTFGFAFAVGTALNTLFVIVEAVFGFLGNSTALLADAGHNLSDVLGLLVAWGAAELSRRAPTSRYTYGLKSTSILAALFNAFFLLTAVGAIAWEAIQRIATPEEVAGKTVIIVATVGIIINGLTAWLFASGQKEDINIRGAFLHMAADAAVSFGVVIAGVIILLTSWGWVDPIVSVLICAIIMWSTWGLLRDSIRMALDAVPSQMNIDEIRNYIEQLPGVRSLHDLHVWPMSTTDSALTCHLVMPAGHPGDEFLMHAASGLHDRFHIGHVTLQVETSESTMCALEPNHVV